MNDYNTNELTNDATTQDQQLREPTRWYNSRFAGSIGVGIGIATALLGLGYGCNALQRIDPGRVDLERVRTEAGIHTADVNNNDVNDRFIVANGKAFAIELDGEPLDKPLELRAVE